MNWVPVVVTIALSLVSVIVAYIGMQRAWKNNLESSAKSSGREFGQLLTDVKHIMSGMDKVERSVDRMEHERDKEMTELRSYVDTKFREHIKDFHKGGNNF